MEKKLKTFQASNINKLVSGANELGLTKDDIVVLCLSGRGDKDVNTIANYMESRGELNE